MSLPVISVIKNVISSLHDNPNTDDNLTAAQLKAKFDQEPNGIIDYLHDTLVPALDSALSALVAAGAVVTSMIADYNVTNIKLDNTPGSEAVSTDVVQDGCITTAKLDQTANSEAVTTATIRDKAVTAAKLADDIPFDTFTGVEKFSVATNAAINLTTAKNSRAILFSINSADAGNFIVGIESDGNNSPDFHNIAGSGIIGATSTTGSITLLPANSLAKRCLLITLSGTVTLA